ncbi:hypothetical protein ACFQ4C_29790 [Larkinella insperata]|uniref:Uncharacterized protein n=1 Tax=Larkinella insperata TaxID=332158 RepID=A0ABW3QNZ0_9BACT
MIYLGKLLNGVSNWYDGLSGRARLSIALLGLIVLLCMSTYKIMNAWQKLQAPLPKADPQEIIKPMQEIFHQVQSPALTDQQKKNLVRLDSLAKAQSGQYPNQP